MSSDSHFRCKSPKIITSLSDSLLILENSPVTPALHWVSSLTSFQLWHQLNHALVDLPYIVRLHYMSLFRSLIVSSVFHRRKDKGIQSFCRCWSGSNFRLYLICSGRHGWCIKICNGIGQNCYWECYRSKSKKNFQSNKNKCCGRRAYQKLERLKNMFLT